MSFQDPNLHAGAQAPVSAAPIETVDLKRLEGLSGLVSDLMNTRIAKTQENLEKIVKDRLGENVSVSQAMQLMNEIRETDLPDLT
jgi:hypothetical protein